MTTNASTELITALRTSLAISGHGWVVRSVSEATRINTVTGTGGETSSALAVETSVHLEAPPLRSSVGARIPMRIEYVATYVSGSYSFAVVRANGGEWKTTNSSLNTTVMGMVTTFLADADTALTAAITAGAVTDSVTVSADLLAALIASLGDADAGWTVRSRSENPTATGQLLAVSLGTMLVKTAPTVGLLPIPTQFVYLADLGPTGAFVSARLSFSGVEWVSRSSTLHTAVMALADAYLTTQDAALTTALEAGPV